MTTTLPNPAVTAAEKDSKAWFRADVDGMRAIAIVLVVFYHAGISLFRGGFIGVDVFFVISGFLISRNLLREADTKERIGLTTFWARRIRRLVPAPLALVIGVTLVAGYLILPIFQLDTFGQQGASARRSTCPTSTSRCRPGTTSPRTSPQPVPAHLVARRRGAVLPGVAAGLRRGLHVGVAVLPGIAGRSRRRVLVGARPR